MGQMSRSSMSHDCVRSRWAKSSEKSSLPHFLSWTPPTPPPAIMNLISQRPWWTWNSIAKFPTQGSCLQSSALFTTREQKISTSTRMSLYPRRELDSPSRKRRHCRLMPSCRRSSSATTNTTKKFPHSKSTLRFYSTVSVSLVIWIQQAPPFNWHTQKNAEILFSWCKLFLEAKQMNHCYDLQARRAGCDHRRRYGRICLNESMRSSQLFFFRRRLEDHGTW